KPLFDNDKNLAMRVAEVAGTAAGGGALYLLKQSLKKSLADAAATPPKNMPNVDLTLAIGGSGGKGGAGGEVLLHNQASITTRGANSWGVFAQSIGGGGGAGGAASSTGTNKLNIDVTLGSSGG